MARPRPPSLGVRRVGALVLVVSCLSGCDGGSVNLGASMPLVVGGAVGAAGSQSTAGSVSGGSGSGPEWIPVLEPLLGQQEHAFDNPSLTLDGQTLVFTRHKNSAPDAHVWEAQREGNTFRMPDFINGDPVALGEDEETGVAGAALSTDGSELWFGRTTPSSLSATDVWVARREGDGWAAPALVSELNSEDDDVPRSPGLGGLVMPLSRRAAGSDRWQIYFATRAALDAPFGEPTQEHLTAVNAEGTSTSDGFLSDDGLTLYLALRRGESLLGDLYRATRSRTDSDFGEPEPLDGLQSAGTDERDPWLGTDGWLYYASNRSGALAIHRARHAQR